mmetsp:Transcript_104618/g.223607  ORF Transcript_104618/g.223607 Transcript_104618/m.223607 type:complete len:254 (-) Transcript_104618:170-931(-)
MADVSAHDLTQAQFLALLPRDSTKEAFLDDAWNEHGAPTLLRSRRTRSQRHRQRRKTRIFLAGQRIARGPPGLELDEWIQTKDIRSYFDEELAFYSPCSTPPLASEVFEPKAAQPEQNDDYVIFTSPCSSVVSKHKAAQPEQNDFDTLFTSPCSTSPHSEPAAPSSAITAGLLVEHPSALVPTPAEQPAAEHVVLAHPRWTWSLPTEVHTFGATSMLKYAMVHEHPKVYEHWRFPHLAPFGRLRLSPFEHEAH